MRIAASAAARAFAKAARRTARPGQIGEGVSHGEAGRTMAATRMRAINTATGIQTHVGAAAVLVSKVVMISCSSSVAPTFLEEEEEDEDDDGGRRN
ncbi:unnamed protein product [Ectocarpus sp. 8 AP-2014]|uniref:Uncharacterized protein n=1 Tax=Ectocarpus siliculosus TaxID=2880 RepID=D8LNR8_ECTSI|nr:hypothetical protein Esi_0005_0153 [Ectocarpus siliculosus]|eukprot:CBN78278.1 hypothetical protein Esi_0005_0153 [Ectocarpus siliculosus]